MAQYVEIKSFRQQDFSHYQLITSWSLLELGVEVGLALNIMKGISIFLFSIVWFIFKFFF
jgi:hypothetical protein